MKVIKTASGKNRIKMSKSEWTSIGKKAVWFGDNFDEAKGKIQEFKDKLSFYNEETAENTNDPEILHKILQRGNSDWVSGFAARNFAARNNNCSDETLRMVLERGNNDLVSRYAARNDNCSDETLRMVLERGNSDGVSEIAAENPNCPLDLALKYKISLLNKNNTEEEIFGEDNGDDFNIFAKNIRI